MLIMGHYTKDKYKFYVKYKYSELCLYLAQTTAILCDHLLWTQKYRNLFNVGRPQAESRYFPTRFKILRALLVKIPVIRKLAPSAFVSSCYSKKIIAWCYWITLKMK